ncbi:MAG TPA: GtrA family protein [Gaiellaceae bacterium]|nr:GtrA family protein [Gaiellaceae bacterium]
MPRAASELVRFGTVGVANTLLAAGTYAVLRHGGVPALLAAPAGFAVGAANGFVWNGRWTFHTRGRLHRYAAVQLLALAATDALLAGHVPYVAVLACVTVCSFAASRLWAFALR